jgi:predicted esterase
MRLLAACVALALSLAIPSLSGCVDGGAMDTDGAEGAEGADAGTGGGFDFPRDGGSDVRQNDSQPAAAEQPDAGPPAKEPPAKEPPAAEAPDAGPKPDVGASPPTIKCGPIVGGLATVVVNGTLRTFDVALPFNRSKMALLFLWHGWMQDPSKFANEIVYDVPLARWVPFNPNAFPMPLMIVTAHDTKMIPPAGLDWDIATGGKDVEYFDGMLKCITEQFTIDKSRIYSFGFSAGAVFTNLLSAKYPRLFAATVSESGAWFSDPAQQAEILVPIVTWKWPALDPADRGNVLLTHGGKDDFATVISLENSAQKAFPYLRANGRTVIDCAHGFGHTLDPDLTQAMYYDYLWRHSGGSALTALPPSFPTATRPVGSTSCQFRGP